MSRHNLRCAGIDFGYEICVPDCNRLSAPNSSTLQAQDGAGLAFSNLVRFSVLN